MTLVAALLTACSDASVTGTTAQSSVVRYAFCTPVVPIWFAYQSESGAWTRVTAARDTFSFNVVGRGAIAYVMQGAAGATYALNVFYGSAADLAADGSTACATTRGAKRVGGTVTGLAQGNAAFVSLGGDFEFLAGAPATFVADSLPDGPIDLVASRVGVDFAAGTFTLPDRLILRHDVNYPTNTLVPTIDFNTAEAFAPATARLTINNVGADATGVSVALFKNLALYAPFTVGFGSASVPYAGLPTDRLPAGELHAMSVTASPAGSENPTRGVFTLFRGVADRAVTLGPPLAAPSVSSLGSTPYLRSRAQLQGQSSYGQFAQVAFTQVNRSATVLASAAYFGATPTTWDLAVPDLSAAGFDPTWALRTSARTDWEVTAFGDGFRQVSLGPPTEGATFQFAAVTDRIQSAERGAGSVERMSLHAPRSTLGVEMTPR